MYTERRGDASVTLARKLRFIMLYKHMNHHVVVDPPNMRINEPMSASLVGTHTREYDSPKKRHKRSKYMVTACIYMHYLSLARMQRRRFCRHVCGCALQSRSSVCRR
jgi:hypothetical protein